VIIDYNEGYITKTRNIYYVIIFSLLLLVTVLYKCFIFYQMKQAIH